MDKLWYLKRCNIFHDLDKQSLDKVGAMAKERNIPKKEVIYSPEDENEMMFILKKGRVRIFKLSAYAETLDDSYICAIQQEDFVKLIKGMPQLVLGLIEKINDRLKEAEDRIEMIKS